MENLTQNTAPEFRMKISKRKTTFTSSGREGKTPKHLLTTSEEEGPPFTKTITSIAKEKETYASCYMKYKIIQNQNARILELVAQKTANEACLSDKLYEPLPGFTLESMDEFNRLNDEKNINSIINWGGTKIREFLSSSLQAAMTDKLVSQFTWLGDSKFTQFGNTRVANVLYHPAQKCPYFPGPSDKTQCKMEMLKVLRIAKQRFRKSKKKVQSREPTVLTEIRDGNENSSAVDDSTPEEIEIFKQIRRLKQIENSSDSEEVEKEEVFRDKSESSSAFNADDENQ